MSLFDIQLTGRFRSLQLITVALNAAIMKLGQCACEFPHDLSLYGVYFCLKLLVRSDVCFCDKAQVSCACAPFCVGLKLTIDVSDGSILLLSMEISSTAEWQGRLLAFRKLDQAFENDKYRNNDTDF